MLSVTKFIFNLLGLYLIFSTDKRECCTDTGCCLSKPNISHLRAVSDNQSLVVSWLVKPGDFVSDIYEIQISRTEKHTIIYSSNVSVSSANSISYTWTWISDLPLECVDHSVRLRNFYNQSVQSPWSDWITNYGVKAKNKTELFPFRHVLREGSSAMFCCVPPTGVNITNMTFRNNHYPLLSIGSRVKAITVNNLTIPKGLIKYLLLSCFETTGKVRSFWIDISFPPQKPRNLSCATLDMITVTCTWDSDRKRDPYDPNKQIYTLHIENSNQAPINCEQSSCTFPTLPHLEEYNISVAVKDKLGEEMECYSFKISERVFPVVKWLRVKPGVTDATVSWGVQESLNQMNLSCQVATVPLNTSELRYNNRASGLCEAKLEHLLPNTNYFTRVRCTFNGRFWGEWTQPKSFTTYPLVHLDLWRRIQPLPNSHTRKVTLLWNPHIVGIATTVNIPGYTVKWSEKGQTESRESRESHAEVSIGPGNCDFTVQAVLDTGSSIPAHIIIPPMDYTENVPVKKHLDSTTAGGFTLTWDNQTTIGCGYTVEWCILGNAVPCSLQWVKVPEGKRKLFLHARHFKAGYRYTFNIYGCTKNGHRLLEIQTGYSQELKSVQSPSLIEPVQSTSSSVTLEWHYNEDDPAHSAFITGYLVTMQEVGGSPDLFSKSVADPHVKSMTIEGLKQSKEYVCSVSALTKVGSGLQTSITIRTKTNYPAFLIMILTPIFFLLGCTILLWLKRKILTSGLKKIFAYPAGMNIKTPEFDSFLYEIDQRMQSHKAEECISCEIEILNVKPFLNERTTLRDSELINAPCATCLQSSVSSLSPSVMSLKANYCPQLATLSLDKLASQQNTAITNKSYLYTFNGSYSVPPEVIFSQVEYSFECSDCLQESCGVIYGYISNDSV